MHKGVIAQMKEQNSKILRYQRVQQMSLPAVIISSYRQKSRKLRFNASLNAFDVLVNAQTSWDQRTTLC